MYKSNFYKGKKVLVTGGTGLIGTSLVKKLIDKSARVRIVALDGNLKANQNSEIKKADLTKFENCRMACDGMDYVFHLAAVKGNPKTVKEKPASFFVPILLLNTNVMEAARISGVKRYLYTSTVGVYSPAKVFHEDNMWKNPPSDNDKFAGWAKRMGELQAEAYQIEHRWNEISIVRPANVYGPHDNFDLTSSTAIASLIRKVMDGNNPLIIWGDGTQVRDFIYVDDVADAMMLILEKGYNKPVNLGSGKGYSLKKVVEIITKNIYPSPEIIWDKTKPVGDKKRLMDITRAKSLGWSPKISLEVGIKRTMEWYKYTLLRK